MSFTQSVFILGLLILNSCSSPPSDENAGMQFTVICRNEVQDCYTKAQDLCPKGYLVVNRVRGIKLDEQTTEYRALIRCKL